MADLLDRRVLLAALFGSLLCACEPPKQEPKVLPREEGGGGGGTSHPGFAYAGGGEGQALIRNDPRLAPMIRPPGDAAAPRKPKAKKIGRRPPAGMEMDSGDDAGDFAPDDVDDSTPEAKAQQEKPDPEPAGPLVKRKSQGLDAAPPEPVINTADIKALPTEHGHVKFPPPPEGEADQEELDEAMAAKNTKMNMPKDGAVKMGADADLSLDPNSLGSYHVQVSLTPYFRVNQIDQVYGFGTDIHLEYDLDALEAKTGKYYIRWALIDLLDMEHPFHKPKFFMYIAPATNLEDSGTSAVRPGASAPR